MDKEALKGIWTGAIITLIFFGGIGVFLLPRIGEMIIIFFLMPAIIFFVAISGSISYLINERKKCPNCGKRMDKSVKFCKQCGAEVLTNCPHCKAELKSKASFCEACGKSLTEPKSQEKKELEHVSSPERKSVENIIYCTYCGTQIEPNLAVCPACGESLK